MDFAGDVWVAREAAAAARMDAELLRLQRRFEAAGGTVVWKPNEVGMRNGSRMLAEFDNCGPGGKPVITIYQGGNRGTMAHELFHSEQYAQHGVLGRNVRLSNNPRVRDAMEADVRVKLRAMGYEPRPNNAREFVDNAGR